MVNGRVNEAVPSFCSNKYMNVRREIVVAAMFYGFKYFPSEHNDDQSIVRERRNLPFNDFLA